VSDRGIVAEWYTRTGRFLRSRQDSEGNVVSELIDGGAGLYRIHFANQLVQVGTRLVRPTQEVGCRCRWPPRIEENIDRMVLPKDDLLTS
jgi:hypothetical protein